MLVNPKSPWVCASASHCKSNTEHLPVREPQPWEWSCWHWELCGEETKELQGRLGSTAPAPSTLLWDQHQHRGRCGSLQVLWINGNSSGGVWAFLLKVFCLFLLPPFLLSPKSCTFLAVKSPGTLSPVSYNRILHRGRIPEEWMC